MTASMRVASTGTTAPAPAARRSAVWPAATASFGGGGSVSFTPELSRSDRQTKRLPARHRRGWHGRRQGSREVAIVVLWSNASPGWRNRQTRRSQKPFPFGGWGFDSPSRHQCPVPGHTGLLSQDIVDWPAPAKRLVAAGGVERQLP